MDDLSDAVPVEALAEPVQPALPAPPDAVLVPDQAEAEIEDTRSARERILDHLTDTVEQGPQHVSKICAGTGLSRALVDPVLSRAVKSGQIGRAGAKGEATYRLSPPRPVAPPPPPPAQQVRLDGTTAEQWLEWLWHWVETGGWRGPGDPPGPEGQGVPVDVWMAFAGELDAQAKQQAENAALRDKLLDATGGNHVGVDALSDVLPIAIMIASGIPLDLIVGSRTALLAPMLGRSGRGPTFSNLSPKSTIASSPDSSPRNGATSSPHSTPTPAILPRCAGCSPPCR